MILKSFMMYSLEQLLNVDTSILWALAWARKPLKKKWLKHIIAPAMDYLSILLSIGGEIFI